MAERSSAGSLEVHTTGSSVWVRDAVEGWVKGRVLAVNGKDLSVETEKGSKVNAAADECPLQNLDTRGVEDMTQLNHLHEPGVLWNLKCRYMFDQIYTYTGNILIAVNPFQNLPHLYGTEMMFQYKDVDFGALSPHVYATAERSFRQMVKEGKSQSILVSGESGAGKTETCKLLMNYLAYLGGYTNEAATLGTRGVESKVLESNPLLEAFGNAKTVRNDNSSRFGKFTEIQFDSQWRIAGAAIRTYLLERSRVVSVNDPERNYHVFYQLCDGASPEEKAALFLKPATEFRYLNMSTCFQLPNVDNAKEYAATRRAMSIVGLPVPDQDAIFRIVAAVLHLGNIAFVEDPKSEEACVLADKAAQDHLGWAASLLGVPASGLNHALSTRTRQTPDGPIVSPITASAAAYNRDSLAKTIYARLFDFLVLKVNQSIGQVDKPRALVGVLDIYGFEQFQTNHFEQFCINLANEKLQQHFNQHVFKMEQAEYQSEAIDWSYIEFVDNQDVLDLIEKKPLGILDCLDDVCRFPQATGKDFAEKLYSVKEIMEHKRFEKPKRSNNAFLVDHYAGGVLYTTDYFLDKNKDFVVAEHQELLGKSTEPLVSRCLFKSDDEEPEPSGAPPGRRGGGSAYKFVSVGSQFKKQLAALMETLHTMEPHYVRCIKPNSLNRPMSFDNPNVLQQLRCGGVLEAVRISCAGYPSRRLYEDFVDHFWHLAPGLLKENLDDREITMRIIKTYLQDGYQLGQSKVFLKGGQMAVLDRFRTDTLNASAIVIQRYTRGYLQGKAFRQLRRATLRLQAGARGMAARTLARRMRQTKAATTIQAMWRGARVRADVTRSRNAACTIQAAWRGYVARREFAAVRAERAALLIQRRYRGYAARSTYLRDLRRVIIVQNLWRKKCARAELRRRRAEAREAGKLLQDKKALEIKVAELMGVLETVQQQRSEMKAAMKDAKQRSDAKDSRIAELEAELAQASSAVELERAEALVREKMAENEQLEAELARARQQVAEMERELADEREDGERAKEKHKSELNRLRMERETIAKDARSISDDLMQRLKNACEQRDEAREQVMALEAEVSSLSHQLEATVAALTARDRKPSSPSAHTPQPDHLKGVADSVKGSFSMFSTSAAKLFQSPVSKGAPGLTPDTVERAHSGAAIVSAGGSVGAVGGMGSPGYESEMDKRTKEIHQKQQMMVQQQRQQEQDALIAAIAIPQGFQRGRPIMALVIFRACLHWKAFQLERTPLFDRIIHNIGDQIERNQEDNNTLAYWLTNSVTLLYLLQKNIKPAPTNSVRRISGSSSSTANFLSSARSGVQTWFGSRKASGSPVANGDASIHGGAHGGFKQIEAKYPALLFKQQLDACMGKIFPMLRDNIKRDVQAPLSLCIHAPKTSHGRGTHKSLTPQDLLGSWGQLLAELDRLRALLQSNEVPAFLQRKLFMQLFSFMNVQLFNQLLLRRECCSFANGEYVKHGLAQVENWISQAGEECMGSSWDELRYIRQAVTFLVVHQKQKKSLQEIKQDLCPELSVQQLYRISTMYWDDKYNTETVAGEVLQEMRKMMQEQTGSASHSFLLDDDSSNPFNANDVVSLMDDRNMYCELNVPPPLSENSQFDFLKRELKLTAMASN